MRPKEKISKKKYSEFYSTLTGHSKSYVLKNMEETFNGSYKFLTGMQMYHAWVLKGKIYCQYFLESECRGAWYFDIETFEYDRKLTEKDENEGIEELIYNRMNN